MTAQVLVCSRCSRRLAATGGGTCKVHGRVVEPRKLSARQFDILRAVEKFIEENDYPPSIRDIQTATSISSTSVVDYNIKILERLGFMVRARFGAARAIRLMELAI